MENSLGRFCANAFAASLVFWFSHLIGLPLSWNIFLAVAFMVASLMNIFANFRRFGIFALALWGAAVHFVDAPTATEVQKQVAGYLADGKATELVANSKALVEETSKVLPNDVPLIGTASSTSAVVPASNTDDIATTETMAALDKLCANKTLLPEACTEARAKIGK
jgi:hypothetical protein